MNKKIYITKYALSIGIVETTGEDYSQLGARRCIKARLTPDHFETLYYENDWWEEKEGAVLQAENMRLKKIQSLRKQIEKLEKLTF